MNQLKAASDLGVPVVRVGLLYQQGYFRQVIDMDGAQQALYPYNDPGQLPYVPVRRPNGEWLRLEIPYLVTRSGCAPGRSRAGRVKLYLLDSDDPANIPANRADHKWAYMGADRSCASSRNCFSELAAGGCYAPWASSEKVCHLNEGHAAFATLERARDFMEETGQPFKVALAVTRAGNVFTTHTAVAAGFDRFNPDLVKQFLGWYAENTPPRALRDLFALGRQNPNDSSESFNMAYLAIRGSGSVNGVSRLHGKVSRQLFEPLFAR